MPDNDDLRMNQNETLNCKLALMGVWTEACREAAAYFGVNPDGSGNFSSVTQAQGITDAVRDAAELMDKGYEEIKAAAAKDPRSVAAAAKHCADATANVPTRHLPKASHGAHLG